MRSQLSIFSFFLCVFLFELSGSWQPATAQSNTLSDSLQSNFATHQFGLSFPILSSGIRFIAKTNTGELKHIRFMYHRHVLSVPDMLFYYASNLDLIYKLNFYNKNIQNYSTTWGIAMAPFGVKMVYPNWENITPTARLLGGFVWFNEPFPDFRGLRFNFTYQLDLGIEWKIYKQIRLLSTYSFFHHSNANLGKINPGMDNNMLIVGLLFGVN